MLGHSGLPSFGHGAFFGLGAYGFGLAQLNLVANLWFCLGAAVAAASLGGAIVAAFISHRRGIYYALLTIAFGQVFWFIAIKSHAITGGEDGLLKIARLPVRLGVATHRPHRQRRALLLRAGDLRGRDAAAVAAGPFAVRPRPARPSSRTRPAPASWATTCGATRRPCWCCRPALSGLAGGLFAMAQASAFPDVMSLHYSGYVVMMTLVGGGLVTFWGPLLGALVFLLARDVIGAFTTGWMLWFGLLFVALVMYKPEGLGGAVPAADDRAKPAPPLSAPVTGEVAMALFEAQRSPSALRRPGRAGGHLARLRGRPALRHHGPERRRQDDLLQRADRPLQARPRPRAVRRRRHHRPLAAGHRAAGHRALLPAHEPVRRVHASSRTWRSRYRPPARAAANAARAGLRRSSAGRRGA